MADAFDIGAFDFDAFDVEAGGGAGNTQTITITNAQQLSQAQPVTISSSQQVTGVNAQQLSQGESPIVGFNQGVIVFDAQQLVQAIIADDVTAPTIDENKVTVTLIPSPFTMKNTTARFTTENITPLLVMKNTTARFTIMR